jgi:hypothetical protein
MVIYNVGTKISQMLSNVVNVSHKFIVQFIGESSFESKVEITLEHLFKDYKKMGSHVQFDLVS